jgi:hypothetical protein
MGTVPKTSAVRPSPTGSPGQPSWELDDRRLAPSVHSARNVDATGLEDLSTRSISHLKRSPSPSVHVTSAGSRERALDLASS